MRHGNLELKGKPGITTQVTQKQNLTDGGGCFANDMPTPGLTPCTGVKEQAPTPLIYPGQRLSVELRVVSNS